MLVRVVQQYVEQSLQHGIGIYLDRTGVDHILDPLLRAQHFCHLVDLRDILPFWRRATDLLVILSEVDDVLDRHR